MEKANKTEITVTAVINVPVDIAWKLWTTPAHIVKWNNASPDWHTTKSENDLREGGSFSSIMAAKDGSMSFDFNGIYTSIVMNQHIYYTLADERKARVIFQNKNGATQLTETFEAESENSPELQQQGWQNILDNFKKYAESYHD